MLRKGVVYNMELQSDFSKKCIADALIYLMQKKKFERITNKDISHKAGVSHMTIYRHFKNKNEIISYYLKIIFDEWKQKWDNNDNIGYQIFLFFQENKEIIDILYKANLQHLLIEHILAICDYKEDDPDVMAYSKVTIAYLIFGWCNEWYKRGMKNTPEKMAMYFNQQNNNGKI